MTVSRSRLLTPSLMRARKPLAGTDGQKGEATKRDSIAIVAASRLRDGPSPRRGETRAWRTLRRKSCEAGAPRALTSHRRSDHGAKTIDDQTRQRKDELDAFALERLRRDRRGRDVTQLEKARERQEVGPVGRSG